MILGHTEAQCYSVQPVMSDGVPYRGPSRAQPYSVQSALTVEVPTKTHDVCESTLKPIMTALEREYQMIFAYQKQLLDLGTFSTMHSYALQVMTLSQAQKELCWICAQIRYRNLLYLVYGVCSPVELQYHSVQSIMRVDVLFGMTRNSV